MRKPEPVTTIAIVAPTELAKELHASHSGTILEGPKPLPTVGTSLVSADVLARIQESENLAGRIHYLLKTMQLTRRRKPSLEGVDASSDLLEIASVIQSLEEEFKKRRSTLEEERRRVEALEKSVALLTRIEKSGFPISSLHVTSGVKKVLGTIPERRSEQARRELDKLDTVFAFGSVERGRRHVLLTMQEERAGQVSRTLLHLDFEQVQFDENLVLKDRLRLEEEVQTAKKEESEAYAELSDFEKRSEEDLNKYLDRVFLHGLALKSLLKIGWNDDKMYLETQVPAKMKNKLVQKLAQQASKLIFEEVP